MDEEKRMVSVPYVVHEGIQVRMERTIKRLVYALVLTILLMFASNGLWLLAWCQYDYESEDSTINTNTVDVGGKNGIATYVGDIINGSNSGHIDNDPDKAQTETEEEWEEQGNP